MDPLYRRGYDQREDQDVGVIIFDVLDDMVDDLIGEEYFEFLMINELTWELGYDKHRIIPMTRCACYVGDLEFIKWFHKKGGIFRRGDTLNVCMGGHLEIIKWLYKLNGMGIDWVQVFECACAYGQLKIAQWMNGGIRLYPRSGNKKLSHGLYFACHHGQLEVAKWIHRSGIKYYEPLGWVVSKNGHLEVLKWLFERKIGGFHMRAKHDQRIMTEALENGRSDIVEWLYWTVGLEKIDPKSS